MTIVSGWLQYRTYWNPDGLIEAIGTIRTGQLITYARGDVINQAAKTRLSRRFDKVDENVMVVADS